MTMNDDFNPGIRVSRASARAASLAKDGIDAAGAGAERASGAAFGTLDNARSSSVTVRQGIDQVRGWMDQKAGRVQDRVQATRDKANALSDQVVDYARDEPVKALLIAAAVGAGLMGLLNLIARSDD